MVHHHKGLPKLQNGVCSYVWVHGLSRNVITWKRKSSGWETAPSQPCIWHLLPASICLYCDSNTVPSIMHLIFFMLFFQHPLFCPLEEIAFLPISGTRLHLRGGVCTDRITNKFKLEGSFGGPGGSQDMGCVGCGYPACRLFLSSLPPLL